MTLKCVVLSDGQDNNRQLKGFIEMTDSLTLQATTNTVKETVQLIDSSRPDIIFLNANQYPQVRHQLSERDKAPVFICTNEEQALSNPSYTHLEMNEQSMSYASFLDAVNRALVQLLNARPQLTEPDQKFFFLKSEYRIIKVNYADIIYCEGLKDYTQIYTSKKLKPIITLQNLKSFGERLPARDFVRIHRSYIVSLGYIDSITKKEVEIADKILPIGNSYRHHLLEIVKLNS